MEWSIISEIDANPKKIKPEGIKLFLLKCLNLLIDLIPNNIGIIAAWKWANNKIEKNKIKSETKIILNVKKIKFQITLVEKDTIARLLLSIL